MNLLSALPSTLRRPLPAQVTTHESAVDDAVQRATAARIEENRRSQRRILMARSIYNDHDREKTWAQAVQMQVGVNRPVAVYHGLEHLGYTIGNQHDRSVTCIRDIKPLERGIYDRKADIARLWEIQCRSLQLTGTTTYNDLIAAAGAGRTYTGYWSRGHTTTPVANNFNDLWPVSGNPQAGAYTGSNGVSVQFADTTNGSIQTFGNVSPYIKNAVAAWMISSAGATPPAFIGYDRVVTYELVPWNNNATQTFTQSNTPTGLRYNTNTDQGCLAMITIQTVANATQQSVTAWHYTSNTGVASQSAPCSTTSTNLIVSAATPTATLGARVICPSATAAGTLPTGYSMPLATGDVGVQLVKDFTTSAATINTGKMCWVMMAPLYSLGTGTAGLVSQMDLVMQILSLPRLFDGCCLCHVAFFPVATAATLTGSFGVVWT